MISHLLRFSDLIRSKCIFCSCLIFSAPVIYYFYVKFISYRNQVPISYINVQPITEVLFFSESNTLCSSHGIYDNTAICKFEECGFKKLKKLAEYLNSASTSLDICLYMITCIELAEIIVQKFKDKVKVRIITDKSMSLSSGSQIQLFRKNGIPVRTNKKDNELMHHKFALIDHSVLINGSLNWTHQGICGNYENVVITNTPIYLVRRYKDYFEELWNHMNQD